MRIGVYAGSFDPITLGHMEVIKQALTLVDRLFIVVADNPSKKGMFEFFERAQLIRKELEDANAHLPHASAHLLGDQMTVDFARAVQATVLIRGIRNGADYAYERSMAAINKKIAPEINTIFLPTSAEFEEVSSSTVKALMKYRSYSVASQFVSQNVLNAMKQKMGE